VGKIVQAKTWEEFEELGVEKTQKTLAQGSR